METKRKSKGKKSSPAKGLVTSSTRRVGGFGDRSRVTLKYTSNFSVAPAAGLPASYVFSLNSAFDPDVTGTGKQPDNFDDFSAQYQRYRVWGARFRVQVNNVGSTSPTGSMFISHGPHMTSSSITTTAGQDNFTSDPHTKVTQMRYGGGVPVVLNHHVRNPAWFGCTSAEYAGRDDFSALISADPSNEGFFHINVSPVDYSATVVAWCYIEIWYDVEFWDRVDQTLDLSQKVLMELKRLETWQARQRAKLGGSFVRHPTVETVPRVTFTRGDDFIEVKEVEAKVADGTPKVARPYSQPVDESGNQLTPPLSRLNSFTTSPQPHTLTLPPRVR